MLTSKLQLKYGTIYLITKILPDLFELCEHLFISQRLENKTRPISTLLIVDVDWT